jgi:monoamine oxidase
VHVPDRKATRPTSGTPAVAIVGAGVAGLTAAVALLDAGIVPILFEAADYVGGRTRSTDEPWLGAHRTEWCAELVNSDHRTMLGHIRRLGIPTRDRRRVHPELGELCLLSGEPYTTTDALRDYDAGVRAVVDAQAAAIGMPASWTPTGAAARELDAVSVHDWIEEHVPGGHGSRLGVLLALGYTIECGVDSRQQSAINLVRQLARLAPGAFGVLGTSDERYRVLGGIDQVPRGLARLLPADAVRLNARLVRIARDDRDRAVLALCVEGELWEAPSTTWSSRCRTRRYDVSISRMRRWTTVRRRRSASLAMAQRRGRSRSRSPSEVWSRHAGVLGREDPCSCLAVIRRRFVAR